MPFVTVGDTDIYYEMVGNGPPILFTGGWSLAERTAAGLVDRVKDRFLCIRHDHRGLGRTTSPPNTELSIGMLADDLANLLDALHLDRVQVHGGGGMGALVGLEFALRHRDRVTSLHLGEPSLYVDAFTKALFSMWSRLFAIDRELWAAEVTLWCFAPETFTDHPSIPAKAATIRASEATFADHAAYERIMAAMAAVDFRGRLSELDVPTLITSGGKKDLMAGSRTAHQVHQSIKGSKLHVFEEASHGYTHEYASEYLPILERWLDENR